MYKFILRNGNKKRGKVLFTVYNESLLADRVRRIRNEVQAKDEWDYIDLEKNGKLLKTVYALTYPIDWDTMDLDYMESYCRDLAKGW